MTAPVLLREAAAGFPGGEHLRVQQAPEVMVGRILAHVRGGGQQQQMAGAPAQTGVVAVGRGATGQGFRQSIAAGLADAMVLRGRRQLVRLVENHQVVGGNVGAAQPFEDAFPRQGVQGDDHSVAALAAERVASSGVRTADNAKRQLEQGAQLPLPIAHQAGRRHDEHPPDAAPAQHFPHGQAGHDGFAGAGVVGQQEAHRLVRQDVLVNGNALMGQRVDAGNLAGEGRVELVAEGQPLGLGHRQHRVRVAGEIQGGQCADHP